jgi:hypothetical protein
MAVECQTERAYDVARKYQRKHKILRCDWCHKELGKGRKRPWGWYQFDPKRAMHTDCMVLALKGKK